MKKILLFILFTSFVSLNLLGQKLDSSNIDWTEESPLTDASSFSNIQIYTTKDSKQVFVKIQHNGAIFDLYDENLKHIIKKEFVLKYNKKKINPYFSYFVGDIVYLIGFYYDKKEKYHTIVSQGINVNTLEYTSTLPKYWNLNRKIELSSIRKSISPDNSKFALLLLTKQKIKRKDYYDEQKLKNYFKDIEYNALVFDNQMQMIWKEVFNKNQTKKINYTWKKDSVNPDTFELFRIFFVDNYGRIISVYKGSSEKTDSQLYLTIMEKDKKDIKYYPISVSNAFFDFYPHRAYENSFYNSQEYYHSSYEQNFTISENNEFIIVFCKKNQNTKISEKIHFHKINIDTGKEIKIEKDLSLNKQEQYFIADDKIIEYNKDITKFNNGVYSYYIKEIKTNEKGETLIIAEKRINYFTLKTDNTRIDDLLVFKIDANGKLVWKKEISKKQKGANMEAIYAREREYIGDQKVVNSVIHVSYRYLTSFVSFWINDKIFILYNEHPSKSEGKDKNVFFEGIKGNVVMIEIDNTGKLSKSLFYTGKEQKTFLIPSLCKQISKNQLLLIWKEGYEYNHKITKLTF